MECRGSKKLITLGPNIDLDRLKEIIKKYFPLENYENKNIIPQAKNELYGEFIDIEGVPSETTKIYVHLIEETNVGAACSRSSNVEETNSNSTGATAKNSEPLTNNDTRYSIYSVFIF